LFTAKVAIVTLAILAVLYGAGQFIAWNFESQTEQFAKGGPAFWGAIENKLYKVADEPDLPPEKKQKIFNALHKLSVKYKPYLDVLAGEALPGESRK
jgi:hypothetical protein